MSSPKKHHFVPRLLLDRFTHDGYLWYMPIDRDVDLRRTRSREIGHVNGGHTTVSYKGEVDSVSLERQMGVIESEAGAAISALLEDSNMSIVPPNMAAPIAWLASLQSARSRAGLGYLADAVDRLDGGEWGAEGRTQEARTALERQTALLRATTTRVMHSWHARQSNSGRPKDQWDHVATTLMGMRWDVMRYDDRCLAVSDAFAAQYGIRSDAPGDFERSPFMAKYGLNTPLWAAEGLTIALTPQVALHLHHGNKRRVAAAAGVNMHTIRSARSFVAFPADFNPASVMPGWIDWILEARGVRAAMPPAI